jgi:hypothetical protein
MAYSGYILVKQKLNNNMFETHGKFFLTGTKTQRYECGRRILLGDDTGGGTVMLRPIGFQCVWELVSAGLPYIYIHS